MAHQSLHIKRGTLGAYKSDKHTYSKKASQIPDTQGMGADYLLITVDIQGMSLSISKDTYTEKMPHTDLFICIEMHLYIDIQMNLNMHMHTDTCTIEIADFKLF
jgi:hypothetical protein